MTPTQVLEEQLALERWWLREGGDQWARMQEAQGAADNIVGQAVWEPELLGSATTYYITPNMQHLVEHAARELTPEQAHRLAKAGAPSPTGFLLLAQPIPITRAQSTVSETISILTWEVTGSSVRSMTYSDKHPLARKWKYLPSGLVAFDTEKWEELGYEKYFEGRDMFDLKLLVAFWHIAQQRVAVIHHQHVNRDLDRKLNRRRVKLSPEVQVVVLRREAEKPAYDPDAPHEEVFWTHRWPVTGHWREQPYPSEGVTRTIWIDGYIKGPEHLPLVIKDKVFKLAR